MNPRSIVWPGLSGWPLLVSVRRWPVPWFFGLALFFSWADWLPMIRGGETVRVGSHPSHFAGLLGPLVAGLIVTAASGGGTALLDLLRRMVRWRVGLGGWLGALSPFAFLGVALGVLPWIGQPWPRLADFGRFGGLPEVGPLGVWLLLSLWNGFGEETGWRGVALPLLQRRSGPITSSLIIAGVWAIWHLPTFRILESYRSLSPAVLPGFFLGLACGSVVLTWLYNRTQSVLMVALWHGSYNLVSGSLATRGPIAATVSALVMVQAVALLLLEARARGRGAGGSVLGPRRVEC